MTPDMRDAVHQSIDDLRDALRYDEGMLGYPVSHAEVQTRLEATWMRVQFLAERYLQLRQQANADS